MPPNSNIFQPGPAWVYVSANGIPSNGTFVTVGTGNIELQSLSEIPPLPANYLIPMTVGTNGGGDTDRGYDASRSLVLVGYKGKYSHSGSSWDLGDTDANYSERYGIRADPYTDRGWSIGPAPYAAGLLRTFHNGEYECAF
uniref:Galactose oxidase-like Early set domain-containing protein n=1 Tax=Moniliophthora roreri TaxID=221103 RepID=A0A0W0FUK7_MONRR